MTRTEVVALAKTLAPFIRAARGLRGKDGRDGLGIEDATLVFDDARGFVLRLVNGERQKDFILPIPYDAGVWTAGKTYAMGAGATWEGHYWIALKETQNQPGESSADWRLAVRRGKQGRDGKIGPPGRQGGSGEPGPQGPQGRKGDPTGVL